MDRRSVSFLSCSASSLWSCCHSIGLKPANLHHSVVPTLSCSTGCNWSVLLSWCLEANQRLLTGRSAVPGNMAFPSVWPVHGASLMGEEGQSRRVCQFNENTSMLIRLLLLEGFISSGNKAGRVE